jgi:hypothetical protein
MSLSPPPHPITPYPNPRPCASFRKRIRPFCARDPPPLRAPSLSHATCRARGTSAPHTPNRIQPRPAPPRLAPSHPQCPTRVLRVLVTGLRDGGRGAWVGRVPRARARTSHRAPLLSNPHLTLALSETPLAQNMRSSPSSTLRYTASAVESVLPRRRSVCAAIRVPHRRGGDAGSSPAPLDALASSRFFRLPLVRPQRPPSRATRHGPAQTQKRDGVRVRSQRVINTPNQT